MDMLRKKNTKLSAQIILFRLLLTCNL